MGFCRKRLKIFLWKKLKLMNLSLGTLPLILEIQILLKNWVKMILFQFRFSQNHTQLMKIIHRLLTSAKGHHLTFKFMDQIWKRKPHHHFMIKTAFVNLQNSKPDTHKFTLLNLRSKLMKYVNKRAFSTSLLNKTTKVK